MRIKLEYIALIVFLLIGYAYISQNSNLILGSIGLKTLAIYNIDTGYTSSASPSSTQIGLITTTTTTTPTSVTTTNDIGDIKVATRSTSVSGTYVTTTSTSPYANDLNYARSYQTTSYTSTSSSMMSDKPDVIGNIEGQLIINYADGTSEVLSKIMPISLTPSLIMKGGKAVSSISARAVGTLQVSGLGQQAVADVGVILCLDPYGLQYAWHSQTSARYIITPAQTSIAVDLQLFDKPIESFTSVSGTAVYVYLIVNAEFVELANPNLVDAFAKYLSSGSGTFTGISKTVEMSGTFEGPSCTVFYQSAGIGSPTTQLNSWHGAYWNLEMVKCPYQDVSAYSVQNVGRVQTTPVTGLFGDKFYYYIKINTLGDYEFKLKNQRPSAWIGTAVILPQSKIATTLYGNFLDGSQTAPKPSPVLATVDIYYHAYSSITGTLVPDDVIAVNIYTGPTMVSQSVSSYSVKSGSFTTVRVTLPSWDSYVLVETAKSSLGGITQGSELSGNPLIQPVSYAQISFVAGDWYSYYTSPHQRLDLYAGVHVVGMANATTIWGQTWNSNLKDEIIKSDSISVTQTPISKTVEIQTPEPNEPVTVTTNTEGTRTVITDNTGEVQIQTTSTEVIIGYNGKSTDVTIGASDYKSVSFDSEGNISQDQSSVTSSTSPLSFLTSNYILVVIVVSIAVALMYLKKKRKI